MNKSRTILSWFLNGFILMAGLSQQTNRYGNYINDSTVHVCLNYWEQKEAIEALHNS